MPPDPPTLHILTRSSFPPTLYAPCTCYSIASDRPENAVRANRLRSSLFVIPLTRASTGGAPGQARYVTCKSTCSGEENSRKEDSSELQDAPGPCSSSRHSAGVVAGRWGGVNAGGQILETEKAGAFQRLELLIQRTATSKKNRQEAQLW